VTGDIVTLIIAGDAGQFRIVALASTASRGVIHRVWVEAVFVVEVTLPATNTCAVDTRRHGCNAVAQKRVDFALDDIITSAKKVMFLPEFVCLSVC